MEEKEGSFEGNAKYLYHEKFAKRDTGGSLEQTEQTPAAGDLGF
jgi:hypothetical protein